MRPFCFISFVIPAKAGIHLVFSGLSVSSVVKSSIPLSPLNRRATPLHRGVTPINQRVTLDNLRVTLFNLGITLVNIGVTLLICGITLVNLRVTLLICGVTPDNLRVTPVILKVTLRIMCLNYSRTAIKTKKVLFSQRLVFFISLSVIRGIRGCLYL